MQETPNHRVETIKNRLASITRHSWRAFSDDDYNGFVIGLNERNEADLVASVERGADKLFIANAPNDVEFLLAERERLLQIMTGFGIEVLDNSVSVDFNILRFEIKQFDNLSDIINSKKE